MKKMPSKAGKDGARGPAGLRTSASRLPAHHRPIYRCSACRILVASTRTLRCPSCRTLMLSVSPAA